MLLFQMGLEKQFGREAYALLRTIRRLLQSALAAPEFEVAVDLVAVSLESWLGIKRLGAVLLGAGVCPYMQVLFPGMLCERFSFPETLAAVLTAEAVCAFVDRLMAF